MALRNPLVTILSGFASGSQVPSGLLVDLKPTPHAGVDRPRPSLSWIVPHLDECDSSPLGQVQSHFQVQLSDSSQFSSLLGDTNRVASSSSVAVSWPTADLQPASVYWWRVRTWASESCASGWSDSTKVITGNFGNDFSVAKPVWLDSAKYVFLRKEVTFESTHKVSSAHVYVAAVPVGDNKEKYLGAYRLYVDGIVAGTGPGRGSSKYTQPGHPDYDILDLTDFVVGKGKVALSMQGFNDKGDSSAKAVLELHINFDDGSKQVVGTDSTWFAFNADNLFSGSLQLTAALGAIDGPKENIDVRLSPSGDGCMTCWRLPGFAPTDVWQQATERGAFSPALNAKITQPITVQTGVEPANIVEVAPGHYFFDFGTELMAGLELEWTAGNATINLRAGEELTSNTSILFPMRTGNKYEMNWVAGNATSSFEQHEFWMFRYGEMKVSGGDIASATGKFPFKLTAWQVLYPWVDSDSSFDSSDEMLNNVWELCRNSLKVTSLDTTTDSNTRERLPYEADGFITGSSRYVFQREFAWQRHSTINNLLNPTWPTEWRQTIPLLGHADYMMTGETGVAEDNWEFMNSSSQAECINASSGLLDFSNCSRKGTWKDGVKDIVDWPRVARDGYQMTDVNTVTNAYAVGALKAMAVLANATGKADEGEEFQRRAAALSESMAKTLFDNSTGLFLDGQGGEAGSHSAWHAQVFPLFFGAGGAESSQQILAFLKSKRMVGSVYAAFAFVMGLYRFGDDHGEFALEMLTNCDDNSWCNMIRQGATAVMEAWTREEKPNLSWSHPWASAPATAIAQGVMGITALAPGYSRFEVRPQPGKLTWAELKLPVLSGFIHARVDRSVSEFKLALTVPGNTVASVCLPKLGDSALEIQLDGKSKTGFSSGDFVCFSDVGSGQHMVVRKALSATFV